MITSDQFSIGEGASVSFPPPANWLSNVHQLSKLTPKQKTILETGIRKGIEDAHQLGMKLNGLAIDIYGRTRRDPPDNGLGIEIAGPYRIMMSVNPGKIGTDFYFHHLPRLITHECSHIDRVDNYGIPVDTIEDALASEGLALRTETEAGHPPADFNRPTSPQVFADYIRHILPHLNESKRDGNYTRWFFGPDPKRRDPAFGGYPLGHAVINSYMKATGCTLRQTTQTKTTVIIEHWQKELAVQDIGPWAKQSYDTLYPARKAALQAKAALPHP